MPKLPQQFNDERICGEYLIALRWPNGFRCDCGSRHAVRLKARADTFECRDCGRQTSVMAGTLMHRSKLSLRQWFLAIHIFANHQSASVVQLCRLLGIGRTSAALLKSKLDPLVDKAQQSVQQSMLEGPVTVFDGIITLFADDQCTLIGLRDQNSGHIRAALLSDGSINSIERFLAVNVRAGAALYYFNNRYEDLTNYSTFPAKRELLKTFAFMGNIGSKSKKLLRDEVDQLVQRDTARLNNKIGARSSFETLLRLAVTEEPTSYWDMVDVENPRAGRPTVRRSIRHRKTAYGMRQDGSKRGPKTTTTPEP